MAAAAALVAADDSLVAVSGVVVAAGVHPESVTSHGRGTVHEKMGQT